MNLIILNQINKIKSKTLATGKMFYFDQTLFIFGLNLLKTDVLLDMAKHGNDIQLKGIPNAETVKAIKDAHAKKGFKAKNVDELFKQLET